MTFKVTIITSDEKEHTLFVEKDQYILEAALNSGIDLPYSCEQGWCLSCAVKIISGKINQKDSRRFYKLDAENNFGLICSGTPETDLIIRSNAVDEMKQFRAENNLPFPRGKWGHL